MKSYFITKKEEKAEIAEPDWFISIGWAKRFVWIFSACYGKTQTNFFCQPNNFKCVTGWLWSVPARPTILLPLLLLEEVKTRRSVMRKGGWVLPLPSLCNTWFFLFSTIRLSGLITPSDRWHRLRKIRRSDKGHTESCIHYTVGDRGKTPVSQMLEVETVCEVKFLGSGALFQCGRRTGPSLRSCEARWATV